MLSATIGRISIFTFWVIEVSAGIASASFTLVFSLTTVIIQEVLKITRNKKKKHNKIVALAKSKLNSIKTLISQGLIDLEISHEEFKTIVKEKERCEKMKELERWKVVMNLVKTIKNMRENRNACTYFLHV